MFILFTKLLTYIPKHPIILTCALTFEVFPSSGFFILFSNSIKSVISHFCHHFNLQHSSVAPASVSNFCLSNRPMDEKSSKNKNLWGSSNLAIHTTIFCVRQTSDKNQIRLISFSHPRNFKIIKKMFLCIIIRYRIFLYISKILFINKCCIVLYKHDEKDARGEGTEPTYAPCLIFLLSKRKKKYS